MHKSRPTKLQQYGPEKLHKCNNGSVGITLILQKAIRRSRLYPPNRKRNIKSDESIRRIQPKIPAPTGAEQVPKARYNNAGAKFGRAVEVEIRGRKAQSGAKGDKIVVKLAFAAAPFQENAIGGAELEFVL